jgi:hypothetical protein
MNVVTMKKPEPRAESEPRELVSCELDIRKLWITPS